MFIPVSPSVRSLQETDQQQVNNSASTPLIASDGSTPGATAETVGGRDVVDRMSEETKNDAGTEDPGGEVHAQTVDDEGGDNTADELRRRVSFNLFKDQPSPLRRLGDASTNGGGRLTEVSPILTLILPGRFVERRKSQDVETQTLSNGRPFDTIEEVTEESEV